MDYEEVKREDGNDQIDVNNPNTVLVNQLLQKFKSKDDLYMYLSEHCQKFLPPKKYCSMRFMQQLLSGKKTALNLEQIRKLKVPYYKELSIVAILEEIQHDQDAWKYLPDGEEIIKGTSRDFVFSILNTIREDYMKTIVQKAIDDREKTKSIKPGEEPLVLSEEMTALLQEHLFTSRKKGRAGIMFYKKAIKSKKIQRKNIRKLAIRYEDFYKDEVEKAKREQMNEQDP